MDNLLEVTDLCVAYPSRSRRTGPVRVVEDVSFVVPRGKAVALVGESGSGKTTIGRAILGLQAATGGSIRFDGRDITVLTRPERRKLAKDLQVVFQDPVGSLNPALKVGAIIMEPMLQQRDVSKTDARQRINELIRRVGLPSDAANRYPGQFSGGQRQRVAIARALALNPKLVICDEPTSALDVSTQAQVLDLLAELREQMKLSYLFISHDLAIVRQFCDEALVLKSGRLVESGPADRICDAPQHPYTRNLVAAAPIPDPVLQAERRAAQFASERRAESVA